MSTITVESSGHECEVSLSTWLKDVLPRTPGAVRAVVKRELVLAAREFFEQSLAWRATIGPKQMRVGKSRYSLSPFDAYADIVAVFSVELQGTMLAPMTRMPAEQTASVGRPTHYWLESPDTVRLWPEPDATVANALVFYVALMPKDTVTKLPRIAKTHFYDALLDGLLGRLFHHPSKPYSNLVLAQYHLKRFRTAIGEYAARSKQGFAGAAQWRYPKFGR